MTAPDTLLGLAAKLTEAQRERLLAITREGRLGVRRGQGKKAAETANTMPTLLSRFWRGDSHGYRLTPLGVELRDFLRAQASDPGGLDTARATEEG